MGKSPLASTPVAFTAVRKAVNDCAQKWPWLGKIALGEKIAPQYPQSRLRI